MDALSKFQRLSQSRLKTKLSQQPVSGGVAPDVGEIQSRRNAEQLIQFVHESKETQFHTQPARPPIETFAPPQPSPRQEWFKKLPKDFAPLLDHRTLPKDGKQRGAEIQRREFAMSKLREGMSAVEVESALTHAVDRNRFDGLTGSSLALASALFYGQYAVLRGVPLGDGMEVHTGMSASILDRKEVMNLSKVDRRNEFHVRKKLMEFNYQQDAALWARAREAVDQAADPKRFAGMMGNELEVELDFAATEIFGVLARQKDILHVLASNAEKAMKSARGRDREIVKNLWLRSAEPLLLNVVNHERMLKLLQSWTPALSCLDKQTQIDCLEAREILMAAIYGNLTPQERLAELAKVKSERMDEERQLPPPPAEPGEDAPAAAKKAHERLVEEHGKKVEQVMLMLQTREAALLLAMRQFPGGAPA